MLHKYCRVLQKPSSVQFIWDKKKNGVKVISVTENGIKINGLEASIIELEQRRPLNPPTGIPTWVYQ